MKDEPAPVVSCCLIEGTNQNGFYVYVDACITCAVVRGACDHEEWKGTALLLSCTRSLRDVGIGFPCFLSALCCLLLGLAAAGLLVGPSSVGCSLAGVYCTVVVVRPAPAVSVAADLQRAEG